MDSGDALRMAGGWFIVSMVAAIAMIVTSGLLHTKTLDSYIVVAMVIAAVSFVAVIITAHMYSTTKWPSK